MDVEKLKKINQLSKEFKKHGMAMEDAIREAGDTIHEPEIKEFLQKSKEQIDSTKNPSSAEQYIVLLERNNRKIMEEVQNVKEEIKKIMNEFAEIKKQLQEPPAKTIREEIPQQKKTEKQTQLKQKKKQSNPRQGDYTSDDVSIEKMFYFGNKK